MPPSPASAASPSGSAAPTTPSWWESVSKARSRILALASILPPQASPDVEALADTDHPALALLRSAAAYAALSSALRSGGGADSRSSHAALVRDGSMQRSMRRANNEHSYGVS